MLFLVSYILITVHSILSFMNPLNFVTVILKVLLVNLLAALNFANVFANELKVCSMEFYFLRCRNFRETPYKLSRG